MVRRKNIQENMMSGGVKRQAKRKVSESHRKNVSHQPKLNTPVSQPAGTIPSDEDFVDSLVPDNALVGFVRILKDGSLKNLKYTTCHRRYIIGPYEENALVKVKYGIGFKHEYDAKIERISSDQDYLNALRKELNGRVGLCTQSMKKFKEKSKKSAKSGIGKALREKESLDAKISTSVASKINSLLQRSEHLPQRLDSSPTSKKARLSGTQSHAHKGLPRNQDAIPSKNIDTATICGSSQPQPVPLPSRFCVPMMLSVEEEALVLAFREPDTPKVTPQGLATLSSMMKFSKLLATVQNSCLPQPSTSKIPMTPLERRLQEITKLKRDDEGNIADDRVELVKGSGVFIGAYEKDSFTCNLVPMELARRLLKHLLTPDLLARMSVGGSREYPAIPKQIISAVHAHVLASTDGEEAKTAFKKDFNTKINAMCGFIRYEKGLCKKAESKLTKNGLPRQKAGRKRKESDSLGNASMEESSNANNKKSHTHNPNDIISSASLKPAAIPGTIVSSDAESCPSLSSVGEGPSSPSASPSAPPTDEDEATGNEDDDDNDEDEDRENEEDSDDDIGSLPSNLPTPTEDMSFNFDSCAPQGLLVSTANVLNS